RTATACPMRPADRAPRARGVRRRQRALRSGRDRWPPTRCAAPRRRADRAPGLPCETRPGGGGTPRLEDSTRAEGRAHPRAPEANAGKTRRPWGQAGRSSASVEPHGSFGHPTSGDAMPTLSYRRRGHEPPRARRTLLVAALTAATLTAVPGSAFAETVSPTGKGIAGGALLGAELVVFGEALFGVRSPAAYIIGASA